MLVSERLMEARPTPKTVRRERLRVGVVAIAFLIGTACGSGTGSGLPAEVSHFPADLNNSSLAVSGIYSDGWTKGALSLNLEQPRGDMVLAIRGTIPRVSDGDFRTDVLVRMDQRGLARQSVGIGEFRILTPTKSIRGEHRIELTFSATQQLPGGDGRMVGARLQSIGFEKASSATGSADLVRGSGVQLGSGWGVLETFRGERFRWVDNNAQILLTPVTSGDVSLSLLVESGPGLGGRPFILQVLDGSGRRVDAVRVTHRSAVELFLPAEADKTNEFRLHVEGGGKPAAKDPRILNFRVFRITVEPPSSNSK